MLLGREHLGNIHSGISYPGVVIVTDHNCLWWPCCSASVDKGCAVAWLLDLLAILDCVLFLGGLVAGLLDWYFFYPKRMN